METVTWSARYETGIDIIDEQHRELFRRIDMLTLSLYEGEGKIELKNLLEYLETYVTEHFKTEKVLLSQRGYPDLEKHLEQHREFISSFAEIRREYAERGPDSYLAIRVEKQVKGWWQTHVLETDMRYVPYVRPV